MQHLEYMDARYIEVSYGPESDIAAAEDPTNENVLSLFVDEGVVITGTAHELLNLTARIVLAISEEVVTTS